jgi:hypothetical protein
MSNRPPVGSGEQQPDLQWLEDSLEREIDPNFFTEEARFR